jgi:hypothetical protein
MRKNLIRLVLAGAVMAAAAVAPTGASAIAIGPCQNLGLVDVCLSEVGPTAVGAQLYKPVPGAHLSAGDIAAYLDTYQLGAIQLHCVTPVVNGTEVDACGTVGLTRVAREILVGDTDLGTDVPRLEESIKVYVCTATLKLLVAGNGTTGTPVFTVCASGQLPA